MWKSGNQEGGEQSFENEMKKRRSGRFSPNDQSPNSHSDFYALLFPDFHIPHSLFLINSAARRRAERKLSGRAAPVPAIS
jgi:hypothetical protein